MQGSKPGVLNEAMPRTLNLPGTHSLGGAFP